MQAKGQRERNVRYGKHIGNMQWEQGGNGTWKEVSKEGRKEGRKERRKGARKQGRNGTWKEVSKEGRKEGRKEVRKEESLRKGVTMKR